MATAKRHSAEIMNATTPTESFRGVADGGYAAVEHTADLALRIWGNDFRSLMQ